jgi:hypothetical protein
MGALVGVGGTHGRCIAVACGLTAVGVTGVRSGAFQVAK